jgi:hypothetical protein
MDELLTQNAIIKGIPTMDDYGKAVSFDKSSAIDVNCRFVSRRSTSVNSKMQVQIIDAEITAKQILKLGDYVEYNSILYKVYSSQEWRSDTEIFGSLSKLILV